MVLPKLSAPLFRAPAAIEPLAAPTDAWPDTAWSVLSELGIVLSLVGGVDLALSWYPFAFQNPEWEFGTITATLDGMPLLALGLGLVLAGALYSGTRWLVRTVAILLGLLSLIIVAAALLYATNVPLAIRAMSDPAIRIGLYKAMLKTTIQAIAYPSVFLWIALRSWR